MPRKFTKKFTKKGYGSRRKSRSTFSYYKSRSSKAQAYQIAKLDKRINTVYKNLGGEVVRYEASSLSGTTWPESMVVAGPIKSGSVELTLTPSGQNPKEILYRGVYANVNIRFKYPVVTYSATANTTPTIWVRFLVIQYYQAGEAYQLGDFLNFDSSNPDGIFNPLNEDVGTKARILKDFRVSIDQRIPERHFKIKVKKHFRVKKADGVSTQKGTIMLYYITYNQAANSDNIGSYSPNAAAYIDIKPYNYMIYDRT